MKNFSCIIDHTLLKSNVAQKDIKKLCDEARKYKFYSVCVNSSNVRLAAKCLKHSNVKVCAVVGFPLGAETSFSKAVQACEAVSLGADEIDMVINIGALKSGDKEYVFKDIELVRRACAGRVLKVIIETAYLTDSEKITACKLAKKAGADFVKTSTGFAPSGAKTEDIRLMRKVVGKYMGVKASGGIKDFASAREMVKAGASRLGTSSGIAILSGGK
ncbi:MAG: deoxyribose-phosphate aldolase [Elusimicrobia bacterium]|nr:deoxyribose-phosphate aldolase [Elusimicrobiota bacterium]